MSRAEERVERPAAVVLGIREQMAVVSIVSEIVAWPSRVWMALGCRPAPTSAEAYKCRRSWNQVPRGSSQASTAICQQCPNDERRRGAPSRLVTSSRSGSGLPPLHVPGDRLEDDVIDQHHPAGRGSSTVRAREPGRWCPGAVPRRGPDGVGSRPAGPSARAPRPPGQGRRAAGPPSKAAAARAGEPSCGRKTGERARHPAVHRQGAGSSTGCATAAATGSAHGAVGSAP